MNIGEAKRIEEYKFLETNVMRFNIDKYKIMHLGKVIISVNLKLELPILKQSYQ